MEELLDFAMGPLFGVSFLIMILGLGRHVLLQVHGILSFRGDRFHRVRWKKILRDSLSWVLPAGHLVPGTVLMSVASFTFHVGVILVPLFLADHVYLWGQALGISLPRLSPFLADILTLVTVGAGIGLCAYRLLTRRTRSMSRPADYLILGLVLLPFVSGYMAMHPRVNPLPWHSMMLIHVLSADLLFVVVPFSKLAHIVLFPFNRLSEVHWQLRPGAGDRVAEALFGEEARV